MKGGGGRGGARGTFGGGGGGGGGGTFMTGVPDQQGQHPTRRAARGNFGGGNHQPVGANARNRVSRQDQHISGWLAKKKAREAGGGMGGRGGGARGARSVTVGKGASGGKRYGSKPMQQFHEMRSQMDKRKCEFHGVQGFMLLLAWFVGFVGW